MKEAVGLKMADGLILPYLKMTGRKRPVPFKLRRPVFHSYIPARLLPSLSSGPSL